MRSALQVLWRADLMVLFFYGEGGVISGAVDIFSFERARLQPCRKRAFEPGFSRRGNSTFSAAYDRTSSEAKANRITAACGAPRGAPFQSTMSNRPRWLVLRLEVHAKNGIGGSGCPSARSPGGAINPMKGIFCDKSFGVKYLH